jgi:hypothetical protein
MQTHWSHDEQQVFPDPDCLLSKHNLLVKKLTAFLVFLYFSLSRKSGKYILDVAGRLVWEQQGMQYFGK